MLCFFLVTPVVLAGPNEQMQKKRELQKLELIIWNLAWKNELMRGKLRNQKILEIALRYTAESGV